MSAHEMLDQLHAIEREQLTRIHIGRGEEDRRGHPVLLQDRVGRVQIVRIPIIERNADRTGWQVVSSKPRDRFAQRQHAGVLLQICHLRVKRRTRDEIRRHPSLTRELVVADPVIRKNAQPS